MANYRKIDDHIFIGPQPTEQDLSEAKQQGIRTVLDFRMPAETASSNAEVVRRRGLDYVNIPVDKTALSQRQIAELDEAMKQKDGPYLLHCATGTRAAMLLALRRAREQGWNAERTFQEAEAMGFNLRSQSVFASFVEQATAHK